MRLTFQQLVAIFMSAIWCCADSVWVRVGLTTFLLEHSCLQLLYTGFIKAEFVGHKSQTTRDELSESFSVTHGHINHC